MAIESGDLVGGGEKAPTTMTCKIYTGSGSLRTHAQDNFAAETTSTVTSATLTEVMNESTPGVLTFGGLFTVGSVGSAKIKITINGGVAIDVTTAGMNTGQACALIGIFNNSTTNGLNSAVEGRVSYDTIIVEIAGDGANGVSFLHKGFKT